VAARAASPGLTRSIAEALGRAVSRAAWDYVIVGAGAAGCVLAARLSEGGAARVLLVEAGGDDRSPLIHVPAGLMWILASGRLNWRYVAEPDPSRDGRSDVWPAGRVLGGGTSINGMLYVRGQLADFDDWEAAGATGWGSAGTLPYFKRLERYPGGDPAYRGLDGPVDIGRPSSTHVLAEDFVAAAAEAGLPPNEDYNAATQLGASVAQIVHRRGRRRSAARTHLAAARGRAELRVLLGARAHRVTLEGARCTGVEVSRRGRLERLVATRGVILCAGAIASPKLLKLSGIGPAAELRRYGIEVVVDAAGVGRNLREHVCAGVGVHTKRSTMNTEVSWTNAWRHAVDYALSGRGVLGAPMTHALAFAATDGGARPDVELAFSPLAVVSDGGRWRLYDRPAINVIVGVAHPQSAGEVLLRSDRPDDPPLIKASLLADGRDRDTLIAGCRLAREILLGTSFARNVVDERLPGGGVQTEDDWLEHIRQRSSPMFHPIGTCRIGEDRDAPVQPDLKVRGVEGLYVADASVMPTHISGHTHGAAMMIAEKAADLILGRATPSRPG